MVSIITMGKFLPQMGYGYGGAMKYQQPSDEKKRMVINAKLVSSIDKKPSSLKIILRCSDNSGV